ncbi:hypothetical protein NP493_54g05013 [Ridgeia piscesae]|uniref:Piezo non-specific cation channel R-Ras-binding domain-containing protein n=1 Tax=Ridgeia piscesae TaxID=27915 RepID=A0AAD9PAP4_RIDPI|nr:hypothetical protein NP493_54g05013 [Ridgeia piscesae]
MFNIDIFPQRHGLWKDAQDTDKDLAKAKENIDSNTPAVTPEPQPDPGERSLEVTSELGQSSVIFEYSSAPEEEDHKKKTKKAKKDKAGVVAIFLKPMFDFYKQMTDTKYHMVTDVYALMFLCDVITFIIVVFGYSSFGPAEQTAGEESVTSVISDNKTTRYDFYRSLLGSSKSVTSVISDNKVPVPFLVMLLAQFILMIVDRALYLRKDIFGKFILQIILVAVVHIWMFFILPLITQRSFTDNTPAKLWYFVKCVYFGLSAYQIRSSYPYRILGNFLTKKYNYANLFLFKGFLAIPFLLELRCLMDWMWTDTTLSIGPWLQVEDIYANIFCLECWRTSEKTYPTPRGMKKKAVIKYGIGGLLLFILIFIIWFPLLLFSLASTVFQANPPIECELTIQFGSYEPVFHMTSPERYMKVISEYNFSKLKSTNKQNKAATAFLSAYSAEDVYTIEIDGESSALWDISPPSIQHLYNDFMNKSMDVNMYTSVIIKREPKKGMASNTISADFVFPLKAHDVESEVIRHALAGMINGSFTHSIYLGNVFPRFMHVPATGMISAVRSINYDNYSNVTLQLEQSTSDKEKTWWKLQEKIRPHPFDPIHEHNQPRFQNSLSVVTFNDRVAPDTLSFFTNYGIIGLYVSFILVIGSFVRMQTSGLTHNIMFDELPFVQRILHLCNDIYLVRESGDMALEEELVAKLIFLYRSPQTMIKWTRPPKEKDD